MKRPQTLDGTVVADAVRNRLWHRLPRDVRERLARRAKRVRLTFGQAVFQAHERPRAVFFPETAVISRVAHLSDGQALEVGLIDSCGMAGIAVLPGATMAYDGEVQIGGTAVRVDTGTMIDELSRPGPAHDLLGKYAWALFGEAIQMAACNNFHTVSQRCARWLLMLDDAVGRDDFPITHELLAQMTGVRRATVTRAAQALHRAGVIAYRHGHMTVSDRRGLEAAACECYRAMRQSREALLGY